VFGEVTVGVRDKSDERRSQMQSDFEFEAGLDEPLERGRLEDEESNVEEELMLAAASEFRELPVSLAERLT
jgi:hypothetical protein